MIHWALAICVTLTLFVFLDGDIHEWLGYLALVVVVVRILRPFWSRKNHSALPLGRTHASKIVYFAMGLFVIALGLTGFLMGTDRFWGDPLVSDLHYYISQGLIGLLVGHGTSLIWDTLKTRKYVALRMIYLPKRFMK